MTDDERLLEIATRLMAAHIGNAEWKRCEPYSDTARRLLKAAEELMNQWRARTGAREEREQDVSDELLVEMIHALGCDLLVCEECCILDDKIVSIQRARAAGKGEG